jgi:hypothetical protein
MTFCAKSLHKVALKEHFLALGPYRSGRTTLQVEHSTKSALREAVTLSTPGHGFGRVLSVKPEAHSVAANTSRKASVRTCQGISSRQTSKHLNLSEIEAAKSGSELPLNE